MERDNPSSVYHRLYQALLAGILILVFIYVWSICLYLDRPIWAGVILGTLLAGILVMVGWLLGAFWSWIRGY